MPTRVGSDSAEHSMTKIAIVGGGYTGAITAILLSRMASRPLDIQIIEPRSEVGRGVAYDTKDPAHRLNVPPGLMVLYLDDIDHFDRHVGSLDLATSDPDAVAADGSIYTRRIVFGDYMVNEVRAHMSENASRSRIRHVRDRATAITSHGAGYRLTLAHGTKIMAEGVVLCTSHGQPALPPGFDTRLAGHAGLIMDPWSEAERSRIGEQDRVLIVGAGLTGADVVASLQHRGHTGDIVMLSRHGLPSNRQHDFGDINKLLDRVRRPVPNFISRHGQPVSVQQVLRAVRQDVRAARGKDKDFDWREAFDHVRDAAGAIWRGLPASEKRRYTRHLSSYYGSHRNRVAPQVVDNLEELQCTGQLTIVAGRVVSAQADDANIAVAYRLRNDDTTRGQSFQAVVNCTGPVHCPTASGNAFLDDLANKGIARADAYGLGIDVDETGSAIGINGRPSKGLYATGPLTRGYFGDVIGVPQITAQLHTILPALLRNLIDT